jgi:hypothetical protein
MDYNLLNAEILGVDFFKMKVLQILEVADDYSNVLIAKMGLSDMCQHILQMSNIL